MAGMRAGMAGMTRAGMGGFAAKDNKRGGGGGGKCYNIADDDY